MQQPTVKQNTAGSVRYQLLYCTTRRQRHTTGARQTRTNTLFRTYSSSSGRQPLSAILCDRAASRPKQDQVQNNCHATTFLYIFSIRHVLLFSVALKGTLTGRTGLPAACRVDIGFYQYLYFSRSPSQTNGRSPNKSTLGCGRDSRWCLPLPYSIPRLLPDCYVRPHTIPCPGCLGTASPVCASFFETLRESTVLP